MSNSRAASKRRTTGGQSNAKSKHKPDFKVGDVLAGMSITVRGKEIVQPALPYLAYREQAVYQHLHGILNSKDGEDLHSKHTLASQLGKSESSVGEALAELVELGLIRREQRGRHGVVTSMLLPPKALQGSAPTEPSVKSRGPSETPRGPSERSKGSAKASANQEGTRKEPGEPQTPTAPRSTGRIKRVNGSAEYFSSSGARNSSSRAQRVVRRNGTSTRFTSETESATSSASAAGRRSPRARDTNQVDTSRESLMPAKRQRYRRGKIAHVRVGSNGKPDEQSVAVLEQSSPGRGLWSSTSGTYDERLDQMKAFIIEHKPSPEELLRYDSAITWLGFKFSGGRSEPVHLSDWPDWYRKAS
jgi:DNA-binding transcriptional ArsR family regulator